MTGPFPGHENDDPDDHVHPDGGGGPFPGHERVAEEAGAAAPDDAPPDDIVPPTGPAPNHE